MDKLKVGQKLYNWQDGNEVEVLKVGKKYFEVSGSRYRYEIKTLKTEKGAFRSSQLCTGKQEVLDRIEADKLFNAIGTRFSNYYGVVKPSLEQLRAIYAILEQK